MFGIVVRCENDGMIESGCVDVGFVLIRLDDTDVNMCFSFFVESCVQEDVTEDVEDGIVGVDLSEKVVSFFLERVVDERLRDVDRELTIAFCDVKLEVFLAEEIFVRISEEMCVVL